MTSIKVLFVDGTSQTFSSANGIVLVTEQFWLRITDSDSVQIAVLQREQVIYAATPNSI
jgi:hypothetical protein